MYSICEILRFKRKSYSVTLKQPTGRPLCTVCLTGDRDTTRRPCVLLLESVNRRQWGRTVSRQPRDCGNPLLSDSHFSTWLKELPPRFLEIAIFLIQLGALSPWQCSFSFELNSYRISVLFSPKWFLRLEGHWEQPRRQWLSHSLQLLLETAE